MTAFLIHDEVVVTDNPETIRTRVLTNRQFNWINNLLSIDGDNLVKNNLFMDIDNFEEIHESDDEDGCHHINYIHKSDTTESINIEYKDGKLHSAILRIIVGRKYCSLTANLIFKDLMLTNLDPAKDNNLKYNRIIGGYSGFVALNNGDRHAIVSILKDKGNISKNGIAVFIHFDPIQEIEENE